MRRHDAGSAGTHIRNLIVICFAFTSVSAAAECVQFRNSRGVLSTFARFMLPLKFFTLRGVWVVPVSAILGGGYGQSNLKAGTGKGGAWAGYHNQGGAYNQGAQQQHQQHQLTNGATANIPLPAAVRGVEEASAVTEYVLRCASAAIEHQQATQQEVEAVLSKLCSLITLPVSPQVSQMLANSALPSAVVRTIRRYQNEAPCAALACVVAVKSTGSTEGAASHIRAGALDEVNNLMDAHPSHGGVQNVSLLMLAGLVKDNAAARTAVASGSVNRAAWSSKVAAAAWSSKVAAAAWSSKVAAVLKAMELTTGREVQSNGLAALRLLLDSGRNNRAFLQ
ncbi:unnamed protein product, partial [Polarella glacialis]